MGVRWVLFVLGMSAVDLMVRPLDVEDLSNQHGVKPRSGSLDAVFLTLGAGLGRYICGGSDGWWLYLALQLG